MNKKLSDMSSKDDWREWAKAERELHIDAGLSALVVKNLETWSEYANANHVLSYLAFGSEVDLAALDYGAKQGYEAKQGYVTRTWMKPVHLTVHERECELELHRYGYQQPVKDAPSIDPKVLDMVLVPGLAFDKIGNRLGYGMGFYDRLLAQLRPDCLRVAITCDALLVNSLPAEDHDVPATHIVTESSANTVFS